MKLSIMRLLPICLIAAALPAAAVTIEIYSTGENIGNSWRVEGIGGPDGFSEGLAERVNPGSVPAGWDPAPPADWVSNSPVAPSLDVTLVVFKTTFDMTGLDPLTAEIQFQLDHSDAIAAIVDLNDVTVIGNALAGSYVLDSGFGEGRNTLEVVLILGSPAPVGLSFYVESATADAAATVPEPTTVGLFGMGVALLTLGRLRRKR